MTLLPADETSNIIHYTILLTYVAYIAHCRTAGMYTYDNLQHIAVMTRSKSTAVYAELEDNAKHINSFRPVTNII